MHVDGQAAEEGCNVGVINGEMNQCVFDAVFVHRYDCEAREAFCSWMRTLCR